MKRTKILWLSCDFKEYNQTKPQSVRSKKLPRKNNAKYHQSYKMSKTFESLKGLANDLLQIHLMISIVHLQKAEGALLKTTE